MGKTVSDSSRSLNLRLVLSSSFRVAQHPVGGLADTAQNHSFSRILHSGKIGIHGIDLTMFNEALMKGHFSKNGFG